MARRDGLARLPSIFYGSPTLLIGKLLAVNLNKCTIEYDIPCDIRFECSAQAVQRSQGRHIALASEKVV